MAQNGSFLSASWYRVGELRPRLREQVRIRVHRYRGRGWYVVEEPIGGKVHRLTPTAYSIVAALDGTRTLNDIWIEATERLGDDTPTQDEVINLLGQLHAADLLQGGDAFDIDELIERSDRLGRSRRWRSLFNPLSVRLPLWNPDRFLQRILPVAGPFFGPVGGVLWLLAVVPAFTLALRHTSELTSDIGARLLAEDNLLILAVCLATLKVLHELGHAVATRRFGGAVHETGLMLLVLMPLPYVDTSAASAFRSKSRRIIVDSAGMLVEIFIAAIALYAWLVLEPGLTRAIAFNVMVAASVTTVLFNGNPLLRYDGYYILADLLEIPNLGQRAVQYWGHLVMRYGFGIDRLDSRASPGERFWFLFYAPAAFIYRSAVMLGIALFLMGQYLAVGVVLAIWSLVSGVVLPLGRAVGNLVAARALQQHRLRALAVTGGVAMLAGLGVLWLPAPLHTVSEGVIWLPDSAVVRAGTDGFLTRLVVDPGEWVVAGQPLAESEEPQLFARIAELRARDEEFEARLGTERLTDRIAAAVTEVERGLLREELEREQARAAALTVRADADGRLAISKPLDLPGRYLRRGDVIGYALPVDGQRTVRATVLQDDADLVRQHLRSIEVKLAGRNREVWPAQLVREVPAGRAELPSPALGTAAGGSLATDPRDTQGTRTLQRVFHVDLALPPEAPTDGFGARVVVRFEHDWEPLGLQLARRFRQLLLSQLQL